MHTIISHPRSSLESWGYAPGWPPAVHGISLCKWSVCASAAKPQMQLGLGAAPGGEGTPGSRPPPRCDSGSAARPACETPVRHSCEHARKRSQSLAPPRYAALSYQATCMERARLRQRCEQLGDEPLERVLRPRRFPPPRPAARSPRALQPGALRKSGGARCGGRERPFPATAHRAGPGWLPAPSCAPRARGLMPGLLPELLPGAPGGAAPPAPAARAPARRPRCPIADVCRRRRGFSMESPSSCGSIPARRGEPESCMKPRRARGLSTAPCRHSTPGPAAATELLLSLHRQGHRGWEPKSFVCGICTEPLRVTPTSSGTHTQPFLPPDTRAASCAIDTCPKSAPSPCEHCPPPAP